MTSANTTTDHETIRDWAEARDGRPARVRGTGEGGVLRIDFGDPEQSLENITWEKFFEVFEENQLASLYQEKLEDGATSRFNKLIDRTEGG